MNPVTVTKTCTWLLQITPPGQLGQLLNANDRTDRRRNPARPWRTAAWVAARQAKLPKDLPRIRVDVIVWLPDNREVDLDNLRSTTKAIVDGLGPPFVRKPNPSTGYRGAAAPGYGVIENDDRAHLDGPHLDIGEQPAPPLGRVDVYVTDLTHVPAGRTWTPTRRTAAGERVTTKRACGGCGHLLGDVTDDEIAAAVAGRPLPDVRGECPACKTIQDGVSP